MKKRKRKLSQAQRLALGRRVLQRNAKDILYLGKIARNKDDSRAVAKYLSAELFACPARGARSLGRIIECDGTSWVLSLEGRRLPLLSTRGGLEYAATGLRLANTTEELLSF